MSKIHQKSWSSGNGSTLRAVNTNTTQFGHKTIFVIDVDLVVVVVVVVVML